MHNVTFGQLGTLAFTMHEMGLTRQEVSRAAHFSSVPVRHLILVQVEHLVMSLSAGAQLGEDLQQDLLRSIG